jgi:C4-type Zn-finger protein
MKGLTELAELLLEKEVIFSEDLEKIFGKRRADVLKEEREAEAKSKSKTITETAENIKEDKKEKKSGKLLTAKLKDKSGNSDVVAENVTTKKAVKKSKTKGKNNTPKI